MKKNFYYQKYDFDEKSGVLSLVYSFDNDEVFIEKITFPNAPFILDETQKKALNEIFFLAHIALGVTYYKAYCPENIVILSGTLSQEQAHFFNTFYTQGLGEFAIKNNLNLQNKIKFPFENKSVTPVDIKLKNRLLVPVGGGKDSCVSIQLLKKINTQMATIVVGHADPIINCVDIAKTHHIEIKRAIDKKLIELNNTQNVYNGHVPITGMLAFLVWASGVLYDYKYVALSCESSANSGNMMQGDMVVNHQYSKSLDFELDFYHLTQGVTPEFCYFSLLRPLNELAIAKNFAKMCQPFFNVFTSCNKAFKLDTSKRLDHWCGNCDKCRFVFLILAPFMDKKTLIQAVGKNLLDDITQVSGYEELLGISGHKPFECVGEVDECQSAFYALSQKPEWQNDAVITVLKNKIKPQELVLKTNMAHHIPDELWAKIKELL